MALFCNVTEEAVIQSIDVPTIYEVPLVLQRQKMDEIVLRKTGLEVGPTPELNPGDNSWLKSKLLLKCKNRFGG